MALAAGAAGVAVLVALVVASRRSSSAAKPAAALPVQNGPKVRNRQRAAGVDRRLLAFLDWWDANGPFVISVVADGGVRSDEALQASLYARGVSKARTLAETPHGRGGALDLAPYDEAKRAPVFDGQEAKFRILGGHAKAHGLAWGGDWQSFKDWPHVEVPDWKRLPMPRA